MRRTAQKTKEQKRRTTSARSGSGRRFQDLFFISLRRVLRWVQSSPARPSLGSVLSPARPSVGSVLFGASFGGFSSLSGASFGGFLFLSSGGGESRSRNLRRLKYITKFHQFDLHFKNHCKEGKLPNYVVIEQRYFDLKILPGNDDHPSHDVFEGQKFVKEVYEALRSGPQWNEMLFVIIYDEHGGFYDHVPTPVTGVPSPDGIVGPEPYNFQFDRLGVRVPAILISPWIDRGTVLHGPSGPDPTSEFEHSSIPATVKKIFNLKDFLTKRDAWAGTFEVVLNRTTPRIDCPVSLPEPVRLREDGAKEDSKISDFQEEVVRMVAGLCGHQEKDICPHELVEDMTVIEAVEYVNKAFKMFLEECDKAKKKNADDSDIIVPETSRKSKSFASKLCSCVVCGGN